MTTKTRFNSLFITLALLSGIHQAEAQGTAFTYQGRLNTNTVPANGFYDFEFSLFTNSAGTGTQVGATLTITDIGVTNGLFITTLNFGNEFTGNSLWLAISARSNGVGTYTPLTPLQQLTPTPYAITAENLDGTLSASQLSGTLPAGLLSGTYGDALTLNNASDSFSGNGAGLTSLNASALTSGTVPDGVLNADVALLDRAGQTFTGLNTFTGSPGTFLVNNGYVAINTNLFTGLGLQYSDSYGEGAIMSAFNNGEGFLSFYTKPFGLPISKQVIFDYFGGVAIDQQGANGGVINNGTTNGAGLTFGINSGEGIASQSTTNGNSQYGLDFYTDFTIRMSISQAGNIYCNSNDLYLNAITSDYPAGLNTQTTINGVNLGFGTPSPFLFGFDGGGLGTVEPTEVSLTWDYNGNVWVSNNLSTATLTIRGGSDLAEPFKITLGKDEAPQGSVMVIDEENPGRLKLSSQPYDTRVAGVLSGANGVNPGIQMQQQGLLEGDKNVALTGRVYVLADASTGAIKPGDLLTTSATPGHAMKVKNHAKAQGAILGKAMSGLQQGKGMVLVLVTLQ